MNKETLDRLIIDRALGALDPDVETLLNDYLERAGISSEEHCLTHEVVRLSRNLLRTERDAALPAFRIPTPVRDRKRRLVVLQAAGVAAMLMIGFFFGRGYSGGSEPVSKRPLVVAVANEPSASGPGIWSINRYRKLSTSHRPASWKWTSAVRQPELVNQGELL